MNIQATKNSFKGVSTSPGNEKWEAAIGRITPISQRADDIRTPFGRDYTRILHSRGYRRLKHKTQVFFAPENDHICTRSEHVSHVESVSFTIAEHLGLNSELTRAIATGHDIGHAPFGHLGEKILNKIAEKELGESFWHEKNGLYFADNIELLCDYRDNLQNLNLTYAVRDGIISHCGEVNQNSLFPRAEAIPLEEYTHANQHQPFTWEGCVVKICDKISYLGRDIEDAVTLGIIREESTESLKGYATAAFGKNSIYKINTTNLLHLFVYDLCLNSAPENGLVFSEPAYELMKALMKFNYQNIYLSERLQFYTSYAEGVISSVFRFLYSFFDKENTMRNLKLKALQYPDILPEFSAWLSSYVITENRDEKLQNHPIFNPSLREDYIKAIILYISGMTDHYLKKIHGAIHAF